MIKVILVGIFVMLNSFSIAQMTVVIEDFSKLKKLSKCVYLISSDTVKLNKIAQNHFSVDSNRLEGFSLNSEFNLGIEFGKKYTAIIPINRFPLVKKKLIIIKIYKSKYSGKYIVAVRFNESIVSYTIPFVYTKGKFN